MAVDPRAVFSGITRHVRRDSRRRTVMIIGSINKDGSTASGTGFTSTKKDTGTYNITFATPFTSTPAVVASLVSSDLDSDQNNNVLMVNPGSTTTVVYITNTDSDGGQDGAFTFIASNGS
jgi:hypothetical protein